MEKIINYLDFAKVDIRVWTIIEANENNLLKKPSIVLKIDFGSSIGIKKSSAQLKSNYSSIDLINKQSFTKTSNAWGIKNNSKGTNTNRVVIFQKQWNQNFYLQILNGM